MTCRHFIIIPLFSVFLLMFVIPGRADAVILVDNGTAMMNLVLPAAPVPEEEQAGREISDCLSKMSGSRIETGTASSGGKSIILGRADAFDAGLIPFEMKENVSELEPEGYLIESRDGNLYLLAQTGQGALWAAYGLLHELGCRWYMPGEMGEVIPKRQTVEVENGRRTGAPDFFYREVWYSWGRPEVTGPRFLQWRQRNRMFRPNVSHGHNLTNSMPPSASYEKRPELYSLVDGERIKQQVCTSNPEVVKLITQTVIEYFDKYPDYLCYSLCPDDNDDFCECENCTKLDTDAFDYDRQKPIVTDRYMTFVNQVAEGIQEKHPGKMVSLYAYINHSTPPEYVKVSPYVVVFLTSSVYCAGHGIGDTHCESRMKMKADLEAWCKACPNVYIYEYDPVPGNAELPWPLFGARAREMPVYKELGVKGLSVEGHCSWATLSPNHWFSAQLLWNADQKMADLLRDYCDGFFGLTCRGADPQLAQIADAMFDYYTVLEKALADREPMIEWGLRDIPDIFTPEIVQSCRQSLNRALETAPKVKHPELKTLNTRLEMVDMGFQYLETYLQLQEANRNSGDFETLKNTYEKCVELAQRMVDANPDYLETESAFPGLKDEYGEITDMRFAPEMGLVTDWYAIGPFSNAKAEGHDTVYPPETKVDLQEKLDGLDGPVEWKIIRAGEGRGYMDLLHHFQPPDWVTVYAYAFIHNDQEREVELRMGSNDTLKVWLGGELIWEYGEARPAAVDSDVVPVRLKAGTMPVLLKISQTGRKWGFYFRITDSDGNTIPGITVDLNP